VDLAALPVTKLPLTLAIVFPNWQTCLGLSFKAVLPAVCSQPYPFHPFLNGFYFEMIACE